MREPDVRDLQADLRNAIKGISSPLERKAAEEALDGILRIYDKACEVTGELLADQKGRIDDRTILTLYSGDCLRKPETHSGDAAHTCIQVIDSDDVVREIYRGHGFSEELVKKSPRGYRPAQLPADCMSRHRLD